MPKYFFTIKHAGMDANGNSRRKIFGYIHFSNAQYIPIGQTIMESLIGGKWSSKDESVTTTQSREQIVEKIEKNFKNAVWGY